MPSSSQEERRYRKSSETGTHPLSEKRGEITANPNIRNASSAKRSDAFPSNRGHQPQSMSGEQEHFCSVCGFEWEDFESKANCPNCRGVRGTPKWIAKMREASEADSVGRASNSDAASSKQNP